MRKAAYVGIFNTLLFQATPVLISAAALATYALRGGALTADVALPALALFQLLRFPVMMLPSQINAIVAGRVAVDRIQTYLAEEEVAPPPLIPAAVAPAAAVTVDGGVLAWRANGDPALRVPSLALRAGSLTVVVGRIGAGKSALLAALLGEVPALRGRVGVAGHVSYPPQTPWLSNASLRDNILFDAPFRKEWYDAVIAACADRWTSRTCLPAMRPRSGSGASTSPAAKRRASPSPARATPTPTSCWRTTPWPPWTRTWGARCGGARPVACSTGARGLS